MAEVKLRDGTRPHAHADHGGRRRVLLEQHDAQVRVDLRDNVLLFLVHDAAVCRTADVVQDEHVTVGRAPREQAAAVDGAERGDALRARVQLAKAGHLAVGAPAVFQDCRLGVGERDGRNRWVVKTAQSLAGGRLRRKSVQPGEW
eukprot:366239-Chlamydomonas_euryale.AAC.10